MNSVIPWINLLIRIGIGIYFLMAAIPKIADPLAFATSIYHYKMLPSWTINAYALIIPWLEVIVGVCLLVGARVRAAAALTTIMLVMFTIAIIWAVVHGLVIDCGCFGSNSTDVTDWAKVAKNTGLILLTAWLWYKPASAIAWENR